MKTHGMSKTPEYQTWDNMMARCYRASHKHFDQYGGRGIEVCEEWKNFEGFFADMGSRPLNHTLDRVDNDSNYCKANCRWLTNADQQQNRRNNIKVDYFGEELPVSTAAKRAGLKVSTVWARYDRGDRGEHLFRLPSTKHFS